MLTLASKHYLLLLFSLCLTWMGIFYSLYAANPEPDNHGVLYETLGSTRFFSEHSDVVLLESELYSQIGANSTQAGYSQLIYCHEYQTSQAFGYITAAPFWSITHITRSRRTLYLFHPAVRYHEPCITEIVTNPLAACYLPNAVDCIDPGKSRIEHIQTVLDPLLWVFGVSQRFLLTTVGKLFLQDTGYAVLDLFLRLHLLSIHLCHSPRIVVRRLRFFLLRSLFLKHDFKRRWELCCMYNARLHVSRCVFINVIVSCCTLWHQRSSWCAVWLQLHTTRPSANIFLDKVISASTEQHIQHDLGGGKDRKCLSSHDLHPYIVEWSSSHVPSTDTKMKFVGYMVEAHAKARFATHKNVVVYNCALDFLWHRLTAIQLRTVAGNHNIFVGARWSLSQCQEALRAHTCEHCANYLSVFEVIRQTKQVDKTRYQRVTRCRSRKNLLQKDAARKQDTDARQHVRAATKNEFPPRPLSKDLIHDVATGFCKSMAPSTHSSVIYPH
jgi:hypothetical protein